MMTDGPLHCLSLLFLSLCLFSSPPHPHPPSMPPLNFDTFTPSLTQTLPFASQRVSSRCLALTLSGIEALCHCKRFIRGDVAWAAANLLNTGLRAIVFSYLTTEGFSEQNAGHLCIVDCLFFCFVFLLSHFEVFFDVVTRMLQERHCSPAVETCSSFWSFKIDKDFPYDKDTPLNVLEAAGWFIRRAQRFMHENCHKYPSRLTGV